MYFHNVLHNNQVLSFSFETIPSSPISLSVTFCNLHNSYASAGRTMSSGDLQFSLLHTFILFILLLHLSTTTFLYFCLNSWEDFYVWLVNYNHLGHSKNVLQHLFFTHLSANCAFFASISFSVYFLFSDLHH